LKAAETVLASNPQKPPSATATGAVVETTTGTPADATDATVKLVQDLQARLAVLELGATSAATAVLPGAAAGTRLSLSEIQQLKDGFAKANEMLLALSARLDAVSTKVNAVADPAPVIASVRGDLDSVKSRIDKIERADLTGSARSAALGAAVASLSRAAQSGQPFHAELSIARSLQPADANLAALAPYAEKGAPVPSALQSSFAAHAEAALKAERDATAGEGLDRLWSGVAAMVTIRPTGTPGGDDTASILARADSKLRAGDLRAAHAETGRLQGSAKLAMDPWRRDANARLKLDSVVAALSRSIADTLSRNVAGPVAPVPAP
jgi:hypothetical protein